VALSADSSTALVGASSKTIGANAQQGAAYNFDFYPQRCVAGSFDNGTVCTFCAPGSYQPSSGQSSCFQAPAGFYVAVSGATQATPAPAGSFVGSPGASSYSSCPAGTLQPASGQSACVAIPKAANSIVYDPLNLLHLYAGIDNAGVYYSTDGGAIWLAAAIQPTNNRIKALLLKPGAASKQFAATYGGGVFASSDSGVSWTACVGNPANLNVVSLGIDANGKLYAGTEAGVFTSADGCATAWTALNTGLPL
jgi:hypothetical protein